MTFSGNATTKAPLVDLDPAPTWDVTPQVPLCFTGQRRCKVKIFYPKVLRWAFKEPIRGSGEWLAHR